MESDVSSASVSPVSETQPTPTAEPSRPALSAVPASPPDSGDGVPDSGAAAVATSIPAPTPSIDPKEIEELREFRNRTIEKERQAEAQRVQAEARQQLQAEINQEEYDYLTDLARANPALTEQEAMVELTKFRANRRAIEKRMEAITAPQREQQEYEQAVSFLRESASSFEKHVPEIKELKNVAAVYQAATKMPHGQVKALLNDAVEAIVKRRVEAELKKRGNPMRDFVDRAGGGGAMRSSPNDKKQIQGWIDSTW